MSAISGYDHDIFLSYAHLDNVPKTPGLPGWVDSMAEQLQREVRQRLGRREFNIWTDKQLAENLPLTDELMGAIRKSALLLVVMSPSYLASDWCRKERKAFLGLLKDRVRDGSVFVVEHLRVEDTKVPSEFEELRRIPFWARDSENAPDCSFSTDPSDPRFVTTLTRLSYLIKKRVEGLGEASTGATRAVLQSSPAVFVARSTDDLEEHEEALKIYLTQAQANVLPRARYPQADEASFKQAMLQDLSQCKVFVQLLGRSRGRELEFAPGKRLPIWQNQIAAEHGIRRMVWRDRALDLSAIGDPEYRALLETARACGIEEFKSSLVDELQRKPEPPKPPIGIMAFVNANLDDLALARDIGEGLKQFGVHCFLPMSKGSPEDIRRDLEENLKTCDGLLLVYGATGPEWIRSQLRQTRKAIAQRDRPLTALAVMEGPPPEKDEIQVVVPNLVTLDCRKGINSQVLRQFADALVP
jgi:hypothetical protein